MPIITTITEHPLDLYSVEKDKDVIEKIVLGEMGRSLANEILKEAILDWNIEQKGDFRRFELKGFVIGYVDFIQLMLGIKILANKYGAENKKLFGEIKKILDVG